ncbi:glycohydrolase toxin TNT-related protein [Chryseobacterium arthrosphaerae]|uniref:glycohydrolase toxin TNT-related protein n=1 Tax=Chryseobacterium arthrosphaerae TaxID=651561 RepID=UPI001F4B295E|nr:glycohydrolase toxin TNT-related protein [Chryseobacterium arthrosphaerae]MDG4654362.1 glycohydrolase toxin TNT-related protein [Chryseobacterium arthrosphaerae]
MKHVFKYLFFFTAVFSSMACSSDREEEVQPPSDVTTVFYKSADELAVTYDPNGNVNASVRSQIFELYRQGKWSELEALFKANNLNGGWPPANGGYNIVDEVPLQAGQKFDRYSGAVGSYNGTGVPTLGGSFTSPIINGYVYTFTQRALNQPENKYDFYYEIDVLNNAMQFKTQTADIIPWFNQTGKGKQTMWKIPIDINTGYQKTWNKLAEEGYIKVTIKKSPSGKYPNLAGTVIQP